MEDNPCRCTKGAIAAYVQRLSGPILDRIDMQVAVKAVSLEALSQHTHTKVSDEVIKDRVRRAREIQYTRAGKLNNELSLRELFSEGYGFSESVKKLLEDTAKKKKFSARGYVRITRVARTIADLAGRVEIVNGDIAEAFSYRSLDRIREFAITV
jgi:magnesium chelatase family protein